MEDLKYKTLSHFGILGMRWGIRRKPGPDGRVGSGGSQFKNKKRHKSLIKRIKEFSPEAWYESKSVTEQILIMAGLTAIGVLASPPKKSITNRVQSYL